MTELELSSLGLVRQVLPLEEMLRRFCNEKQKKGKKGKPGQTKIAFIGPELALGYRVASCMSQTSIELGQDLSPLGRC